MRLQHVLLASLLSIVVISCSSSTTNENTDTKPPAVPTGFSVTPRDQALSLNWIPNTESDLERYEIYWGTQEANLGTSKKVDSSETSAVLEGLNNGTTYYAAVRAVDASGNKSALSSVRSATPTEVVTTGGSSTPTNFTVVAGDKEIRVSWSSSRDDVREYVIYWGVNSSSLSQSKRVDKSNQSVTIEGLSNGTTYFVAMSAVDNMGNESNRTAVVSSTPVDSNTQPPSTPKALVVVPGDGKATVNWSANIEPDLSGYTIYWGTDETSLSQSKRVPATATSTEIIGLSNGTIYYVAMSANDTANSESERSKSQPVTPFKPDTTAPAIARTTPGENADISSQITIKFSETMDVGSVKVTLEPNINLNAPVWSENATLLTLDPKEDFAYGSRYTVRVVGNDKAGNALSGSTSFSFITRTIPDTTAPKVESTSPNDRAVSVPATANISISFDESMNQASVERAFTIEPQIDCTFLWVSDSSLINCDPIKDLSFSTTYTVSLSTEAIDRAGNEISQATSFSFTTAGAPDTTPPTILNSSPVNGERGIARESSITITFSEPMDRVSVQQAFALTNPSYYNYDTKEFSWNKDFTEMTYTPTYGFSYEQNVSWRISDIAEDSAGNTLQTSYVSNFNTR
jgi:hypothetical protein